MFTFNEKTDVGRSRGTLAGVGVDFFRPESESLKIYRHRRPGAYCPSLGRRHWDKMIRHVGGSGNNRDD